MAARKTRAPGAARARAAIALAAALAACGGSAPRPRDPGADKPVCHAPAPVAEALVVDWSTEERAQLDAAMAEGVAVVSYTCKGLKLLRTCKVTGSDRDSYRYASVPPREEVLRLKTREELVANLPLSGALRAAEGGLAADVALLAVGRRTAALDALGKSELAGGNCDLEVATHFVRAATVGAFALAPADGPAPGAAAQIFAAAGRAKPGDARGAGRDGDPESCRKASPTADAAPEQCRGVIALELHPIVSDERKREVFIAADPGMPKASAPEADGDREKEKEKGKGKKAASKRADRKKKEEEPPGEARKPEPAAAPAVKLSGPPGPSCPEGLVRSGARCTTASAADPAHECKPGDRDGCKAMCQKENALSCFHVGELAAAAAAAEGDDDEAPGGEAASAFERACTAERSHPASCGRAATLLAARGKAEQAERLAARGCEQGDAASCAWSGSFLLRTRGDEGGFDVLRRACDLGSTDGCLAYAVEHVIGSKKHDTVMAEQVLVRSCNTGAPASCAWLGQLYADGSLKKDFGRGMQMYRRACDLGQLSACVRAGDAMSSTANGAADFVGAQEVYDLACAVGTPKTLTDESATACVKLGDIHGSGSIPPVDVAKAKKYYERACASGRAGCEQAAALYEKDDPATAMKLYELACSKKNGAGCLGQGRLLENDRSRKPEAKAFYEKACKATRERLLCDAWKRLGGRPEQLKDRDGKPLQLRSTIVVKAEPTATPKPKPKRRRKSEPDAAY
jgi:hypothetical protein